MKKFAAFLIFSVIFLGLTAKSESMVGSNNIEYKDIVKNSSEFEKYWVFLNKRIYPVPVYKDGDPVLLLSEAVFRDLTPAQKELTIKDIHNKIESLRVGRSKTIRNTFSVSVGSYQFCFIGSYENKYGEVGGDFSMYHELTHCEVRANPLGKKLDYYLKSKDEYYSFFAYAISKNVNYSDGKMNYLVQKYRNSYALNVDESYADIVALSYLYTRDHDISIFKSAILLRNNDFCRNREFSHWTAPLLEIAMAEISSGKLKSKYSGDYRVMAMNIIQTTQTKDGIFNYVNNNIYANKSIMDLCH
jgi:hypothetical protein